MSSRAHTPFPWPLLQYWSLRILPMWSLIALMIFLIQLAICGIVHDNESIKVFLQYIDLLPSFIKIIMGGDALKVGNVAGFVAMGYQEPTVLILYMLFAVGVPTGLLAGEVQRGTMELILSRQATKTHVYICAGLITIVGMYALVLVMFMGTVTATSLYKFDQPIPLYSFFKMAIVGGMLASAVGGIALLAAACFRRGTAVSMAVAYLVVNYFMWIISEWWPRMKWMTPATIFHYAPGPEMFTDPTWPIRNICVLISILVASTVLGGFIWSRRDLPM